MALIHLDFESQYCNYNQDVYVILPDRPRSVDAKDFYAPGKKYKVLWLLHGTYGGYSDWIRKSNIETYACENDLAVIMPGVGNSDYDAWDAFTNGYDSCRYIIEELMPLAYSWFPISSNREDNFIAGLSMGGRGTIQFATNFPEKFAAAAVLSSAPTELDAQKDELKALFAMKRSEVMASDQRQLRTYNQMHRYDSVDEYLDSMSNTWRRFFAADREKLPRLFFSIGTEDRGYQNWLKFRAKAEAEGYDIEWHTGPGVHEWRVWERDIQKAIKFFGLGGDEAKGNAY